MIGFAAETDFDAAALTSRLDAAFSSAVERLGDAVMRDCEIYVPYDTGELCRSVGRGMAAASPGRIGCDIVWDAPHASSVYYGDLRGVQFRTEHHAHARARWFESARATCMDAWLETVRG